MDMLNSKKLFVFDIETIPDTNAVTNLLGVDLGDDISRRRQALVDYHLSITDGRNDFIRQLFHHVIVISYASIDIEYSSEGERYKISYLRSLGENNTSEKKLIEGFFHIVEKYYPRLVSFGGRHFDIPVLKYRAMKYGINANQFYEAGNRYEGYNKRYSTDWHCDLLEVLSDFGASARVRLNEICSMLGFPGKGDVEGSDVSGLFDEGRIEEVRQYCQHDVLNTYLVYLRYSLHIGRITHEAYSMAINDVITLIDQYDFPHLLKFKEQWQRAATIDPLNPFKREIT